MTCVLVVGTPRSGTSCIAGVLHHLGVRMTLKEYPEPHAMNPKGFFEDREMLQAMMQSCNWIAETSFAGRHRQVAERQANSPLLRKAISDRTSAGVPWGCKSLLAADGVFRKAYDGPLLIVRAFRSPDAIRASSIVAMGGLERRPVAAMVERANQCVAELDSPTLTVAFEDLTANPEREAVRIAEFVGRPAVREAVEFVDPSLRHH